MEGFFVDFSSLLIFTITLLLVYFYRRLPKLRQFPPGPYALPIVGNLFNLSEKGLHDTAIQLQKKYGDVIGLHLNGQDMVILNSLESIKEAFVEKGDIFSFRPSLRHFYTSRQSVWHKGQPTGVIWTDGRKWRDLRRFTLMSLRDFGVGKKTVEERIKDEVNIVCEVLQKEAKHRYDMTILLQEAISNIICSVCFGSRFDYSNTKFQELIHGLNIVFRNANFGTVLNVFPWLRFLPSFKWFAESTKLNKKIKEFILNEIEQHRMTLDKKHPRDFIDLYLIKEAEEHMDNDTFSRPNMARLIVDLFIAGTETTSNTLRWCLLYLLHYPEVQKKCQEEIEAVVGNSRQVGLADREKLPYVDATIHEVQRISTIVPLSAPHTCDKNATIKGYIIPKGSIVFANIYAVHYDSRYFTKPDQFLPERFLSKDGKFQKHPAFMVFSLGPRICLGEVMARAESFLFLTNLLQRFTFRLKDSCNIATLQPVGKSVLSPAPYELVPDSR